MNAFVRQKSFFKILKRTYGSQAVFCFLNSCSILFLVFWMHVKKHKQGILQDHIWFSSKVLKTYRFIKHSAQKMLSVQDESF